MNNFTPGPWKTAGDGYSITTSGRKDMYVAQTHPFDPVGKANARLIASAPSLLGALTAMQDAYQDSLTDNRGCTCLRCTKASQAAQAAISKATE